VNLKIIGRTFVRTKHELTMDGGFPRERGGSIFGRVRKIAKSDY